MNASAPSHFVTRIPEQLRTFVNDADVAHETLVIVVSYLFIGAGAWDDGLLGFNPSAASWSFEIAMAAVLLAEVIARVTFSRKRTGWFWFVVALDVVSVLTVLPNTTYLAFARVGRLFYASIRMLALIDHIARRAGSALILTATFPLVVPVVAAAVFAFERHQPGSPIHNYLEALAVCFAFALSLGNVRPSSVWSMGICGGLFIMGLMCIGVITNAISDRYSPAKKDERLPPDARTPQV